MDIIKKYHVPFRLDDDPYRRHSIYAFQNFVDGTTPKDLFFQMYGDEAMGIFKEYLTEEDYALLEKERASFLENQ